jgi:hypothetical protein
MSLQAGGRLRAAFLAVIGGQGRGFTDPPSDSLFSSQPDRVLRVTLQEAALRLVDTGRAVSWISRPSEAQVHWLRGHLGWVPPPPLPSATVLPLSIPALAVGAVVVGAAAVVGYQNFAGSGGENKSDASKGKSGRSTLAKASIAAAAIALLLTGVAAATAAARRT